MANITLGGNPTTTLGELPELGSKLPEVRLVNSKLKTIKLTDYLGKKLILNIIPSINTGVCSASARRFNELAADLEETQILVISMDLPFSQNNFCETEGIDKVSMLSDFRFREFGKKFQATIESGNFEGLLSRAVVIVDENGYIKYTEQVPEIGQEPNYDLALEALKA